MNIRYYDKSCIDELDWAAYKQGDYFRRLYLDVIKKGTSHFIVNVENPVGILCVEDLLFPLVLGTSSFRANKSYVASIYSQYVLYGKREIEIEFENKFLAFIGKLILGSFAFLFGFKKLDNAVFVNNWLLSTNLYPKQIPAKYLEGLAEFLRSKFPHSAIVFRSLNPYLSTEIIQDLKQLGFCDIFSRKVFLMSTEEPRAYRKRRNFGHDVKLWKKQATSFHWEYVERVDEVLAEKIRTLYSDLYLGKYAVLNPDFSLAFFLHLIEHKILNTYVLKDAEKIIAVLGYFRFENVQTASVIGYDTAYPRKVGLYRLISLKIVELAEENGTIVHASSGVSAFKASRGLKDYTEYNLVYYAHLSIVRRIPWKVLTFLANQITIPLMRKFNI